MAPKPPKAQTEDNTVENTVTEAPVSKFQFDELPVPEGTRRTFGEPSETAEKLRLVPVGKSFLEAVTIPANITDPGERDQSFKEQCRKLSNRLSSNVRRHKAVEGNERQNFVIRTVNDDVQGRGVRVYRVADTEASPAPTEG